MLKRITRVHLAVARAHCPHTMNRLLTAVVIRQNRQDYGTDQARREYRRMYGPILPLEG